MKVTVIRAFIDKYIKDLATFVSFPGVLVDKCSDNGNFHDLSPSYAVVVT